MDERVRDSLLELLEYVKASAEIASAQAPLVAQEIVWWGIAESLLWVAACVAAIICIWKIALPAADDLDTDDRDGARVLSFAVMSGVVVFAIEFVSVALKAIFAPRLFVIERILEIVG